MTRSSVLVLALLVSFGCAGRCPEPSAPARACSANVRPVGRWTGEWQSHPLAHPDFVRSGNIDLVVAQSGAMTGQTSEHDNPDTGTLEGRVEPNGQFSGTAVVMRGGIEKRYALSGSFVCEKTGPAGAAQLTWGDAERGNLKFKLQAAP